MRLALLAVVVVFTAGIAVLTVLDMTRNGVTWLDVLAILVVILFATGIVGSLLHQPPRQ
jgi:heme A synthase